MDIAREVATQPVWKKYWYVFPVIILLVAVYLLKNAFGNASYIIEKKDVLTAQVEQGTFRVNVKATGVLKPLNIRWVSSQVAGKVEQVHVKAGAYVEQGQVLMQLSNPELHRELEKARWELAANKAESNAAYVALESQLVDLENAVIAAKFNYQSAKLKLDAETALIEQGNATVSALDYQKSQLAVEQQQQYWLAQQQKVAKMKTNMAATQLAQKARLGLVENNVQRMQEQVAALQVRASTSGVVQQVSLELGERAHIGDSVALVADQQVLYAKLQVQEVRVRDIIIGQPVTIDTRTSELQGEVSRIDPAVKAGMVEVDVKLTSQLPPEARPELAVDGFIAISNIEDALYVKRPMYAPRYSNIGLFKLSKDKQFASKTQVTLGQSSVNKIQIVSGLTLGDEIIISDTSDWQEHQEIMIN
ncbi:HlyD family efflux transporter periplasmic adaptor subunit [Thalassotalea sp. G2M2-11]|uniref:efflux RND transporter periplasmic adaptor subunit n=1 Tax=Thalassotalea sp. G2M2-11 TaxID=2787627 RepID=UPI0019D138E1|nr:HlyD family efflux transporter periplasmic adaptor subunit [Thalassotalea sp. G2M2-11]